MGHEATVALLECATSLLNIAVHPEGKSIRATRLSSCSVLQHCKQVDTSPRYDWRKAEGPTKCHIIRFLVTIEEIFRDGALAGSDFDGCGVTAISAGVLEEGY